MQITRKRVLLVEGSGDRRVFDRLLHEATSSGAWKQPDLEVVIDTAEMLISDDEVLGNRQKVESVAEACSNADNLVAFVDREFRDFDLVRITDLVSDHRHIGKLVWSRGHSIENYYFDCDTLASAIESVAFTMVHKEAIDLFRSIFNDILRLSCAASLAGMENNVVGVIVATIHSSMLELGDSNVTVDLGTWKQLLRRSTKSEDLAGKVTKGFLRWLDALASADNRVVRWLCHGHVGLRALWVAYACCVMKVSNDPDELRRVNEVRAPVFQGVTEGAWARGAIAGHVEYPKVVIENLGFSRIAVEST